MGIYDRDYYRKEGPSYIGSWADSGKVIKWLVAVNVIVFILQMLTTPRLQDLQLADPDARPSAGFVTEWLSMKPDAVFYQFQIWRLLTGCFLHSTGGYWHIAFNMLMLWFFGKYMEDLYGHKEFLAFYLAAGIIGNLFWGLTALWAHRPDQPYGAAIGASGAVMGVMVLCALIYPNKTVLLFWFLPLPLWLVALLYVGGDLFMFLQGMNFGVAVAAHLGGAGFALLYQKLEWRLTGHGWTSLLARLRRPSRPRLRVYREERPAAVGSTVPASPADEQLEAKADAVLEKMHRLGQSSLTDEERDILQRASERYRKKRS